MWLALITMIIPGAPVAPATLEEPSMTLVVRIDDPFTMAHSPAGVELKVTGSINVNGTVVSIDGDGNLSVSGARQRHASLARLIEVWGEDSEDAVEPLDLSRVTIDRDVGTRPIDATEHAHLMRLIRRYYSELFVFQPDIETFDDTQNHLLAQFPDSDFRTAELAAATRQHILEEMEHYFAGAWLALQYHRQQAPTVALKAGWSRNNYDHILRQLRRLGLLIDAG